MKKQLFLISIIIACLMLAGCNEAAQRPTYQIGEQGPAGGLIFYDCDADNNSGNGDGLVSSACGWRYLEAAPENINVGDAYSFVFGFLRDSDDGENRILETSEAIGEGKSNTKKLVDAMGESAYTHITGSETTALYAAKLCEDYIYGRYSDWFLPSLDEMQKLCDADLPEFFSDSSYYWSSSECADDNQKAARYAFLRLNCSDYAEKSQPSPVRAIRAF